MFCLELMVHWGLDYTSFNAQPLALINRLYLLNQKRPFLQSSTWVQAGTIAAATYNVNSGGKAKAMSHEDIFPFLAPRKSEKLMEGYDEESQKAMHEKMAAMLG